MIMPTKPQRFCWTRFGTEAGETVESILARKERDRIQSGGIFLWGIGNSVGPAIQELVRIEREPQVIFSPMRSKPKEIDVSPSGLFVWTRASTLNNEDWPIPTGLEVVSRATTAAGEHKSGHYALVCKSEAPLKIRRGDAEIYFDDLENLLSQNKLGHSQVTAVVRHRPGRKSSGAAYPIGFAARLAYPYFVHLHDPEPLFLEGEAETRRKIEKPAPVRQTSLFSLQ